MHTSATFALLLLGLAVSQAGSLPKLEKSLMQDGLRSVERQEDKTRSKKCITFRASPLLSSAQVLNLPAASLQTDSAVNIQPTLQAALAVNIQPTVQASPAVNIQPALQATPAVNIQPAVQASPAVNIQPALQATPAVNIEPAVQASPAVNIQPALQAAPAVDIQPALQAAPAVSIQSAIQATPEVNLQPDLNLVQPSYSLVGVNYIQSAPILNAAPLTTLYNDQVVLGSSRPIVQYYDTDLVAPYVSGSSYLLNYQPQALATIL